MYVLQPNCMDLIHCFFPRSVKHKIITMPNNTNKSISSSELLNWKIDHAINNKTLLIFFKQYLSMVACDFHYKVSLSSYSDFSLSQSIVFYNF